MNHKAVNYHTLAPECREWAFKSAVALDLDPSWMTVREYKVPAVIGGDCVLREWNPFDPYSTDHFVLLRGTAAEVQYSRAFKARINIQYPLWPYTILTEHTEKRYTPYDLAYLLVKLVAQAYDEADKQKAVLKVEHDQLEKENCDAATADGDGNTDVAE